MPRTTCATNRNGDAGVPKHSVLLGAAAATRCYCSNWSFLNPVGGLVEYFVGRPNVAESSAALWGGVSQNLHLSLSPFPFSFR
jgi:hypothetical protein